MVYGYCRISTKKQSIERQIINILQQFPDAEIIKETYTGTKLYGRKELEKLLQRVKKGDTIVFDEVSRMSRNAEEGYQLYTDLYNRGINLVFLKEPHINTEVYQNALKQRITAINSTGKESTDRLLHSLVEALNEFLLDLVKEQIRLAFERAESEVIYLRKRIKEGMAAAGAGEKIEAARTGQTYETNKAKKAKEFILKRNRGFGGDLSNEETWKLAGISKMTFYRYQKELLQEKS
nr:unnamed protein product [uncultured bacterium]